MKAIIFGCTGQDGSHLADLLLKKHYQVVGVSRRTSNDNRGRINHLKDNKNFTLEECDITDPHSVYWLLDKHDDVDEIYNLAAQSFVGVSFKQPGLTWDVTGKGCMNILQSIVDLKIPARFYQASSSEMFGSAFTFSGNVYPTDALSTADYDLMTDLGKHVMLNGNGEKFQNENTKFLPQSPYAVAKCAAHYMTRLYREAYDVHASCGILFNHEGPRRGEQFVTRKITKWIGDFVRWKKSHCEEFKYATDVHPGTINATRSDGWVFGPSFSKLRLGNIKASRDWGYAGDFCEAMWLMLQQDVPDDYVICTGETHTVEEFLQEAFAIIDVENWRDHIVIDQEFYRPAEVDYLRGDCSKAKNVLGWIPKCSFKELVNLMVRSELEKL